MRIPFDLVFDTRDGAIVPRMTVAIGTVTIARGVAVYPVGRLGGFLLAELPLHDLDIETMGGIVTIRGLLRRHGSGRRTSPRLTPTLSGSGSASAS